MTIRAVIFDFGGVIVPGDIGAGGPFAHIEAREGLAERTIFRAIYIENPAWLGLRVGEGSEALWLRASEERLKAVVPAALVPEIMAVMAAHRPQGPGLAGQAPVFNEGILDLVARLRATVRVSILSNAAPGLEAELRDHYRIADRFDDIINSATVRLAKPDARIYHLAAARHALAPEACFFTDDLLHNIEAARGVGMTAHHFDDAAGLANALRAAGVETG